MLQLTPLTGTETSVQMSGYRLRVAATHPPHGDGNTPVINFVTSWSRCNSHPSRGRKARCPRCQLRAQTSRKTAAIAACLTFPKRGRKHFTDVLTTIAILQAATHTPNGDGNFSPVVRVRFSGGCNSHPSRGRNKKRLSFMLSLFSLSKNFFGLFLFFT